LLEYITTGLKDGVDTNSTFILSLTAMVKIVVSHRMNVEFISTPSCNLMEIHSL